MQAAYEELQQKDSSARERQDQVTRAEQVEASAPRNAAPLSAAVDRSADGGAVPLRKLVCALGAFVFAYGVFFQIAWRMHWTQVVRARPEMSPIQYNAAFYFMLAGAAVVAFAFRRTAISALLASIVTLHTFLTLVEDVLKVSFGIDELLFHPYIRNNVPGRVAPNTALAFMIAGTTLIAATSRLRSSSAVAGISGSLMAALGVVATLGYASGTSSAYQWGEPSMAPQAAVGIVVLSAALLTMAWSNSQDRPPRWFPVAVGNALAMTTVLLWRALLVEQQVRGAGTAAAFMLGFGLLTSVFAASSTHWALQATRHSAALAASNEALEREIAQRVAAEQQVRKSERRLFQILESLPVGVHILNKDGEYYYANRCAAELVGVSPEGVSIDRLVSELALFKEGKDEPYAKECLPLYAALHQERAGVEDVEVRRPEFTRNLRAWSVPITDADGHPEMAVSVIADITERKANQRKLELQARELERSNNELQQFAYIASHDLQEPLRTIAGYTQLLARRYKGQLDSTADEFIAFIVDGATRMQNLIQDLLTFSRVQTKGRAFKPLEANEVVDNVLRNLKAAVDGCGAKVIRENLPRVIADEQQLGQLFQNLIGNAIKFRSDAAPEVRISAKHLEKREWQFCIADNGIGISPAHFERIFQLFQRLHTSAEYPGTGIGLAVCKRIVERHGGRLWVDSAPGKGARFFFTLQGASR